MARVGVFVLSLVFCVALLVSCGGAQPSAPAAPTVAAPAAAAPTVAPAAPVATKSAAAAAKELKIGTMAARSGAGAPFGIAHMRGIDIAIEDINGAGGVKVGADTYLLKAVHEDDKIDSAAATAAANKLYYQDQVRFLLTGSTISGLATWSAVAGPQKMLQFNMGVADNIISKDKPSAFRVYATANETAGALFGFLKKQLPGKTKAAIVVRNDPAGLGGIPTLISTGEAMGFSFVAREPVPIPTNDFVPVLTKILPSKPDVMFVNVSAAEYGLLLKQSKSMGWDGAVIAMSETPLKETWDIGGKENVQNRLYSPTGDYGNPLATKEERDLNAKFQQKYSEPLAGMAPSGYNQVLILKTALEKAGSLDTDKLVSVLENMDPVPTIHGPGKFGGLPVYGIKRQLYYPLQISVARDGKWQVIEKVPVESFYRP